MYGFPSSMPPEFVVDLVLERQRAIRQEFERAMLARGVGRSVPQAAWHGAIDALQRLAAGLGQASATLRNAVR
jgi:hypothetical protein